jgi:hypothetical protein
MRCRLFVSLLLSFVTGAVAADSAVGQSAVVPWKELSDCDAIANRELANRIRLFWPSDSTVVLQPSEGETVFRLAGGLGSSQMVIDVEGSTPEARFKSVLGVGTHLNLTDRSLTICGVEFGPGAIVITEQGIKGQAVSP